MANKADYAADNYTKVHMKRDVYAVAKDQAKKQNRTVANYIAHLVQQDLDGQTLQTKDPVVIPGKRVK
jgi:ribosomal protein S17E